ncbi:HAD family hydrolase [Hoeflea sp. TYP-13]|uniref:HAD family hydrolase n=1 Tax=Hoeflea sp. TYP-13 TaxID=3230023 RepID=UPI0034C5B3EE
MPSPLVIFDLDGTLFDTAPDLMNSLNHTIGTIGLEPVHFEDMTYLVGSGAKVMINKALELRKVTIDEPELERLFGLFLDHYGASMPGSTALYPGAADAMDRLSAAGLSMAVCTNKTESMAVRLLSLTGLLPRFAAVTGGNTFDVRKPEAGHLLGTIDMAGGSRSKSLMIGDSVNDIAAARNAGIPSIGVPFGYSDTAVDKLGPDWVMSHYDELTLDVVERLLGTG